MIFKNNKKVQNDELQSTGTDRSAEDMARLDHQRIMDSLDRSQAVIEFEPNGTILRANDNFLATVGYTSEEIVGEHHRIFVDPAYVSSEGYRAFWRKLSAGEFESAEFQRFGKGGKEVWIQATYNPVFDEDGNVIKVIKFATDITRQKLSQVEIQNRSQAVIEFAPDGTILTANELFTNTVGYSLAEIKGQHHRIFMLKEDAASPEYSVFWERLARGEFRQGEFHRVAKDGRELWLQGAYNPVFDKNGNVVKVVKGVSDITDQIASKRHAGEVGNSIASCVTEMSGAIEEISERLTRTASLAKDAESFAGVASHKVDDLNQSSASISKVVDLIQDLADQTNLLALNATIEAARAGDAGRGFSVVASEVKALANQTGRATSDIRDSVEEIQRNIDEVVRSIEQISSGVTEVSTNTDSVAASVEEQTIVMSGLSSTADELLSLQ
ncbi:MAG: methyl-accepting chemotaxis protein [Rubripirellula sp.]